MVRSLEGKHSNYFEAILQLREVTPEVLAFTEQQMAKGHVPVTKIKKVQNGYDYYLSDNSFTKALGKKLQETFGGQIINTATLHTQKKGKELYRGTILFRQSSFKKGDLVLYKGEEFEIKGIGKEIFMQNRKTGEKARAKWKEIKEVRKI